MQSAKHQVSRSGKTPQVLEFRRVTKSRHNVVAYASVRSKSRPTRLIHNVVFILRRNKLTAKCSCEDQLFRGGYCQHIIAALRKAVK